VNICEIIKALQDRIVKFEPLAWTIAQNAIFIERRHSVTRGNRKSLRACSVKWESNPCAIDSVRDSIADGLSGVGSVKYLSGAALRNKKKGFLRSRFCGCAQNDDKMTQQRA
jgi:hypothetical protein